MSRRRTALAAALSLLPLGQPLLLGTLGITTATTAVVLQALPAVALEESDFFKLTPFEQALAKPAFKVLPIAKAITVRIETAGSPGSGVLVKKEGNRYTVLTAWHVVSGNRPGEELAIFTPDGKEHQLEQGSIQRLGEVDMAVMTFSTDGDYAVASIGDVRGLTTMAADNYELRSNQIFVAGYSLYDSKNLRYETTGGESWSEIPGSASVIANIELGIDQGYQLLYNNTTVAGMSGGPLLNAAGELIGIHGRGEQKVKNYPSEFVSKTGVNQGVPITYYELFISGAPVVIAKRTVSADDYLAMAESEADAQTRIRFADLSLALRASSKGYFIRGKAKSDLGDYQGAIRDLDQAIEIDPKCYFGLLSCQASLAAIKHESKDYQGAIADYTKSIRNDPKINHSVLYNYRAIAKMDSKDYQGAIADYNKAIENNPQYAHAYRNRGLAKSKLGDNQGAIGDYTKAIAIDPQLADAYYLRGKANESLGRLGDACNDWFTGIREIPKWPEEGWLKGPKVAVIAIEKCKHHKYFNHYKTISCKYKRFVFDTRYCSDTE